GPTLSGPSQPFLGPNTGNHTQYISDHVTLDHVTLTYIAVFVVCVLCSMFYVLPSPHGVCFFPDQTLRKRLSPTFVFRQCFGSHTLPYASPDEQTYDPQGLWGRATGQLLLPPFPAGCRHLVPEDRWERSLFRSPLPYAAGS